MLRLRTSAILAASVGLVCTFAYVQHQVVGVTPRLRTFVVPVTLGLVLGSLLAALVRLQRQVQALNHRLSDALASTHEQLAATRAQLVRVGRQQTVGVLAGGVAHDLNNLFQVMSGSIRLLDVGTDAERQEVREALTEAQLRAEQLARRMMQLGRPAAPPQRLDLSSRVRSVESLVARVLKPGTRVVWDTDTPLHVLIDATDVDQLVLNLLFNACGALPDGNGSITVRVEPRDGRARLVVQDSGVGMTDETKRRLFEPFFTNRQGGGGTGLGMTVVRDVVDRAQASFDVQSAPGQGTTFVVDFPLAPPH